MNTMLVSRWPFAGEAPRGVADLVDDLGGREVAREAELARGAERAADGAAGLARDAQRVPLAAGAAGRVVHQHRFDERAVVELVERLLGQAAVGDAELRVADGVEAERVGQRRSAAAAGSGAIVAGSVVPPAAQNASAIWRARYGGWPCATTHASSSAGVTPDEAGAFVVGHGSMLAQPGQRPVTALPTRPGAPRRNADHGIGLPPAGWTCRTAGRRPRSRARSAVERPGRRVAGRPDATRPGREPPVGRSRGTSRATAAFARTCRSSSAAGRVGIQAAVLAAERPRQRRAVSSCGIGGSSPRQPRPERPRQQRRHRAARRSPRAPGRVSVPSSGHASWATIGPVSMPVVHPDERDAGRRVAGQDRRPGSASRRGGAAAATDGR